MCLRLTKLVSCASSVASTCRPSISRTSLVRYRSSTVNAESKSGDSHPKSEGSKTESKESSVNGQPDGDHNQCLKEKETLLSKISELDDKYKRALADTENVRQRMQRQIQEAKLFGIQGFCKDLLEVADILQRATTSVPSEEINNNPHLKNLFEGLQMTETQLQKVFRRHGLEPITPLGEKFDPNFHEALFEQAITDKEPGTVSVVSKIGYKLHERTIRPALVGVVKVPL